MATTAEQPKKVKCEEVGEASEVIQDQVEALAREEARLMLMAALNDEVNAYPARQRSRSSTDHATSTDTAARYSRAACIF